MTTLTALETKVLTALYKSAEGNGHDFGFIEDARKAVGQPRQLGGVVTSLQAKGVIEVHSPVTTDSGTYTQFTWDMGRTQGDPNMVAPAAAALLAEHGVKV